MVKTEKARLNVYIDPDVHEKIKKLCSDAGLPISSLVNTLLKTVVDERFQEKNLQDFALNYTDHVVDSLNISSSSAELDKLKEELKKEILEELRKTK